MSTRELDIESGYTSGLEWCMIKLPKEGEEYCGDLHFVEKYRDKVLVGAIDGLGHGENAAHASTRAKYLIIESENESLINIINYCHKNLRSTRGCVMSLAYIDSWERTITWLGVGNVEATLFRGVEGNGFKNENIVLRHGIVGYKLPALQASVLPIAKGDLLLFTTDGIESGYHEHIDPADKPKEIAEYIASNYLKKNDDALILAARFTGEEQHEETG